MSVIWILKLSESVIEDWRTDVNKILSLFSDAFSVGGLYICYAVLCFISVMFVIFIVPETRQKSLEEISNILKNM